MHRFKAQIAQRQIWQCFVCCAAALLGLAGCRTAAPLSPVNLSEPGWKVSEGQAVWQSRRDAPEIAGELLVATHNDGRAWMQFIKTPLPLVTAQLTPLQWQIEFIPEKRQFVGRGKAPHRFIWLHLLRALNGLSLPEPLRFRKMSDGSWTLENPVTGEMLTGYLSP